jgi:hypothetical protein
VCSIPRVLKGKNKTAIKVQKVFNTILFKRFSSSTNRNDNVLY